MSQLVEILNKIPKGYELYETDALVRRVVDSLRLGADPIKVIGNLISIIDAYKTQQTTPTNTYYRIVFKGNYDGPAEKCMHIREVKDIINKYSLPYNLYLVTETLTEIDIENV